MEKAPTGAEAQDALHPAPLPAQENPRSGQATTADSTSTPIIVQQQQHTRPEREANAKDYFRIFSYATRLDIALIVAATLSSMGAGATLPLMNVVFGKLAKSFTDYFTPGSGLNQSEFQHQLDQLALYIMGIFIARLGLGYISKLGFRLSAIRMSSAIRLHYLQALFGQSVHVLDSMPAGSAATTVTSTANTLQLGISEKLGIFIEYSCMVVGSIIVSFTYSWSLTLVTASTIVFILLAMSILLPFTIKGQARLAKAETQANAIASEAFSAIRVVASCGAEPRITQRYAKWVLEARRLGQTTSPFMVAQFSVVFFAMYAGFGLCFFFGSKSVVEGRIDSIATILTVLFSVMLMVIALERISMPLVAASKAMVAASEFFIVIDAPRPEPGRLREPDVAATSDIIFHHVDFAYPTRLSKKILDGLDLRIEANKNTAIVGPSGSGKSTIVGLIEGWYTLRDQHVIAKAVEKNKKDKKSKKAGNGDDSDDEDDQATAVEPEDDQPRVKLGGSITISGHSLHDIDMKWWRSQIGLVQQEPYLFNESVFENVAHGLIGTEWENEPETRRRELVIEACRESFADEFINRMPQGYDTIVGDSGTKLSGGQRQRIAIARSIVKKPKILILDEATSAIDVRGEKIVQAALDRASKGRTTITIAHRLSTIRNADRIVVLQNGRLVEEGTHSSLLENECGVYFGLVHAQKLALEDTDDSSTDEHVKEEMELVISSEKKSPSETQAVSGATMTPARQRNGFVAYIKLLSEQRSRYPFYLVTLFFACCAAAIIPIQAYLFAQVISVFQLTGQQLYDKARFWSLMWFIVAISYGLSFFLAASSSTHLEHFISAAYRQQYLESLLAQRIAFFDQDGNSPGQLSSRLQGDPQALKELLGLNITLALTGILGLIGGLIIAFTYGWKLALVALFVTVPLGVFCGYCRIYYERQFNAMNEEVFADSSKWAAESIGAFRTVTALVMEDTICDRYQALLHRHSVAAYKKARWTSLLFAFADSISFGCQALVFWYGGRLLATHEYDTVAFFVTFMAVIQGAEGAGQCLSFVPNATQASAAANRILNTRASTAKDVALTSPKSIPDIEGGMKIEFRDVTFTYPSRDVPVIRGLDLTIEKGQFVALVGASGSGKTSIISLLERFYDPDHGHILFNGTDITETPVRDHRKLLSLVAQEPLLFHGSLRDNILLGVDDPAAVTDAQLHDACCAAHIHDFIISLPDGYNTAVGNRGVNLSGGQKQRVALARALMRAPRVLLLDEATSSLDSESERAVQAALNIEVRRDGRTTIAIAHRLATIQHADVIYVMGDGVVLEKGSHVDLVRKRGMYWNMCQNQALDK